MSTVTLNCFSAALIPAALVQHRRIQRRGERLPERIPFLQDLSANSGRGRTSCMTTCVPGLGTYNRASQKPVLTIMPKISRKLHAL